jgi:hypothetical protein
MSIVMCKKTSSKMNIPIFNDLMPILVFAGILMVIWAILSWIADRNARTRKRRGNEDSDPGS